MSGTWRDEAVKVIGQVHAGLPLDADIKTRKRALNAARPYKFSETSHGRKTWGKAATDYLVKFGMKRPPSRKLIESPLGRIQRRNAPAPLFDEPSP